jgi:hypothetical protein
MGNNTELYQEAVQKRIDFNARLVLKSWEDKSFRDEFLADPRKTLEKELGQKIPEKVEIHVIEETRNTACFVIPQKPVQPATDGMLTEEALAAVAAGTGILYKGESTTFVKGTAVKSPAVFLVWFD